MKRHRSSLILLFLMGMAATIPAPANPWTIWPTHKQFQCQLTKGDTPQETITSFNSIECAGHAMKKISIPAGDMADTITFQARTRPNATKRNQEVMLEESSGELFFKHVTLKEDWTAYVIKVKQLDLYTYGTAIIRNGKPDHDDVRYIRFNCYPSSWVPTRPEDIIGISGEDPIVDQFK